MNRYTGNNNYFDFVFKGMEVKLISLEELLKV